MQIRMHGGGCCGIRHLVDFGHPIELTYAMFADLQASVRSAPEGRAIEVVLIDTQAQVWGPALAKIGFKHVYRFLNTNSRNVCNVFLYHNNPLPLNGGNFSMDPSRCVAEPKLIETPEIGMQVVIHALNAIAHGRTGVIKAVHYYKTGPRYSVFVPYYNETWVFSQSSLLTA